MATGMIYIPPPPPPGPQGCGRHLHRKGGLPTPAWLPRAENSPRGTPSPSPSCLHPPRVQGTG